MRAIATTAGALGAAGRGIITQNNNDTQSSGSPGDGVKGARPIHLVANPALHSAGHGRGFERWMGKPRLILKRPRLIDARSLGGSEGHVSRSDDPLAPVSESCQRSSDAGTTPLLGVTRGWGRVGVVRWRRGGGGGRRECRLDEEIRCLLPVLYRPQKQR